MDKQLQTADTSTIGEDVNAGGVAESNQPQIAPEPPLVLPVFIGCADIELINKLADFIDKEKYEIALLAPDILRASTHNWFYNKLSQDEQQRQSIQRKDEERRISGLKYANELVDYWEPATVGFRMYDLKRYYTKERLIATGRKFPCVNFGNKDIENLTDLLLAVGFMTPIGMDDRKHKQEFVITVDSTSRIKYLQDYDATLDFNILELNNKRQLVAQEISEISAKLLKDADLNLTDNNAAQEAPKKRKQTKKKKTAGEEQVAPSDAVNDR